MPLCPELGGLAGLEPGEHLSDHLEVVTPHLLAGPARGSDSGVQDSDNVEMQVQDGGGAPTFHQLLQLIQLQGEVRVSFIIHSVIFGIVECLLTNIEDVNIGAIRVFLRRTLLRIWNVLFSLGSLENCIFICSCSWYWLIYPAVERHLLDQD